MPKYILKNHTFEARQFTDDVPLVLISESKGEQRVVKGDWLIGSQRGQIYSLSNVKFKEQFSPVVDEPQTTKKTSK